MLSRDAEILRALAADCAGRQKLVAADAFPAMPVNQAESELSAILAGRRRLTVSVLREATSDPERTATLSLLAEWAHHRIEPVRRDPAETLERVATQLDLLLDTATGLKGEVADTREMLAELRAPRKVEPAPSVDRRRA